MKLYIPLIIILSSFCFVSAATCDPAVLTAAIDGAGKIAGVIADGLNSSGDAPEVAGAFGIASDITSGSVAKAKGNEYKNYRYEGETYTITFINDSDYDISIKGFGFGISKQLYRRYYNGSSLEPKILTVNTYGKNKKASDYKFIYDETKAKIYKSNDPSFWEDPRIITFVNIESEDNFFDKNKNYDIMEMQLQNNTLDVLLLSPIKKISNNVMPNNNVVEEEKQLSQNNEEQNEMEEVKENQFSALEITNFEKGKYYIQLGSFRYPENVQLEIRKIDKNLPILIMKMDVKINGVDTLVHRILIGPLNYNESQNLLWRLKTIYHDAFIWTGK
jgi:hypothetical protein